MYSFNGFYRSNAFMEGMRQIYYKAVKQPISFSSEVSTESCMQSKLRLAVDLCKDSLPPLLKIDEQFGMTIAQMKLHPQLRALTPLSMKSATTVHEEELPSSVSYCLLKVQL